jgi:hypothetical protein
VVGWSAKARILNIKVGKHTIALLSKKTAGARLFSCGSVERINRIGVPSRIVKKAPTR